MAILNFLLFSLSSSPSSYSTQLVSMSITVENFYLFRDIDYNEQRRK
jgi:hypothetical protein